LTSRTNRSILVNRNKLFLPIGGYMRKIILATITALAVVGSLAVASPAMAKEQPKKDGPNTSHCTDNHGRDDAKNKHCNNHDNDGEHDGDHGNPKPDTPPVVVVPVVGPTAAPKGPGPYLQAYGLVSDPTCQLTPDWAKWEGVPDGGWNPSWGEWMNGGTGGAVCQRTVELVGGVWTIAK
jgi:hypothetical protein